jgi:hypothetical protein
VHTPDSRAVCTISGGGGGGGGAGAMLLAGPGGTLFAAPGTAAGDPYAYAHPAFLAVGAVGEGGRVPVPAQWDAGSQQGAPSATVVEDDTAADGGRGGKRRRGAAASAPSGGDDAKPGGETQQRKCRSCRSNRPLAEGKNTCQVGGRPAQAPWARRTAV